MLETTNILVNKLSLKLCRQQDQNSEQAIGLTVLEILYQQICQVLNVTIEWRSFARGGSLASADGLFCGLTASSETQDGEMLWAATLILKDQHYARRRWKYYIALKQFSRDECTLYYAKCCYDHMAGSVRDPRPIVSPRDALPDALFYNTDILCMCGSQPYPVTVKELNSTTYTECIASICDETRPIPIMLITCPDVIPPEAMLDRTLGNLVVYWCDDSRVVMRLNEELPREMFTPWDSVHIFTPIVNGSAYHPCYSYEEIHRMGVDSFFAGIRRAYCESMHSEEKRSFFTVDDVHRSRYHRQIRELSTENENKAHQLSDARCLLEKRTAEIQSLQAELARYRSRKTEQELSQYETLLNECMAEIDGLKNGIAALSTRLYSTMGIGFQPDDQEPFALLQELSHAIHVALTCVASRGHPS